MLFYYSVLNASTGSFLLANLDGISPAISVSSILIIIKIIAPAGGSDAILGTAVKSSTIILTGIVIKIVT